MDSVANSCVETEAVGENLLWKSCWKEVVGEKLLGRSCWGEAVGGNCWDKVVGSY